MKTQYTIACLAIALPLTTLGQAVAPPGQAALQPGQALITIETDKPGNRISPTLHGVFFEEISHAGEGGLYAELIQNRGFEESRLPPGTVLQDGFILPPRTPHFSMPNKGISDWKMEWPLQSQWPAWSMQTSGHSVMKLSLTHQFPLNAATPHSLQVDIGEADPAGQTDLLNEGFWGINAVAGDVYHCSFYVRTGNGYKGTIRASLQSADGKLLASYRFDDVLNKGWQRYHCDLVPAFTDPAAKFVLSFGSKGTVWVDFVSLFPAKTFMNRPNGLRNDLARYIADLHPAFVRWPGGCFVEGIDIQSAPDWRRSIGPVEKRQGTYSPWGYWSSDGFGYQEYLQFCEDIGAAALYVFNAGVSCDYRSGTFIPDDSLQPYIQNALDAIEYAIGPPDSKWGRVRAATGHPKPFPLRYVEVGNEQHGPRYASRYNRFYAAIKKKYPQITILAAMGIGDVNNYTLDSMKKVDMPDEHAYKSVGWAMTHYDHFDKVPRGKWPMYVGEYATNNGVGTGNMEAALSDAVYIMGMERNGDLVKMSSYAPLLVNEHDVDWPVNLIHFDASRSFARSSYYAIKMMNDNRADINLSTHSALTKQEPRTPAFRGGIGLATWDTQSEYKDIEVIRDGKIVYASDFLQRPGEWLPVRGSWKVQDSAWAQTIEGAQLFSMLPGRSFDTYTLKLKARKLGGVNAFIIPFAVKDSNTFLRAHIGSWVNSHCVIERVTNGVEVADLSEQKRLSTPLEPGRWYDIRLEVGTDTVKCFLDDQLILTYTVPDGLFAISGKENSTGDIIIKVVNTADSSCHARLELKGTDPLAALTGSLTTLSAANANAENSFDHPQQYVPVTIPLTGIRPTFERDFPPYSISILRLHTK